MSSNRTDRGWPAELALSVRRFTGPLTWDELWHNRRRAAESRRRTQEAADRLLRKLEAPDFPDSKI